MSPISFGIQIIMPKTGNGPTVSLLRPAGDSGAAPTAAKQAPPPPGMGMYVDKTV